MVKDASGSPDTKPNHSLALTDVTANLDRTRTGRRRFSTRQDNGHLGAGSGSSLTDIADAAMRSNFSFKERSAAPKSLRDAETQLKSAVVTFADVTGSTDAKFEKSVTELDDSTHSYSFQPTQNSLWERQHAAEDIVPPIQMREINSLPASSSEAVANTGDNIDATNSLLSHETMSITSDEPDLGRGQPRSRESHQSADQAEDPGGSIFAEVCSNLASSLSQSTPLDETKTVLSPTESPGTPSIFSHDAFVSSPHLADEDTGSSGVGKDQRAEPNDEDSRSEPAHENPLDFVFDQTNKPEFDKDLEESLKEQIRKQIAQELEDTKSLFDALRDKAGL